jgi:hypothetical protein
MPVDGAPVLGSNPYVGAAASAGSAAASLAGALQAAASQHDRLMAQQRQQAAAAMIQQQNKRADLLSKGAKPYQEFIEQRDANGMIQRTPNPGVAGMDKSRVMQFPALRPEDALYIPSDEEREESKQQITDKHEGKRTMSLTPEGAQEGQNAGYNSDPNVNYAPGVLGNLNAAVRNHQQKRGSHTIDKDNFSDAKTGERVPVMIDDEGNVKRLNLQADLTAASGAADSAAQAAAGSGNAQDGTASIFPWSALTGAQTTGQALSPDKNTVSPSSVVRQTAPQVAQPSASVAKPGLKFTPKPTAPKSLHPEKTENNAGDVRTDFFDGENGKLVSSTTEKGIGKTSDVDQRFRERQQDRQDARDSRQQDRADKIADAGKTRHDKLQSQEQDQWNLQTAYSDLADPSKHKDGDFVPEPRYNANTGEMSMGQDVTITAARRKAYTALAAQAKTKAQGFHSQAADIRQKFGWGEFAKKDAPAQQSPAQPAKTQPNAASAPAAQTPQTSRMKPAKRGMPISRDIVRQYIQKYGSAAAARKIATADGWSF